MGRFQSGWNETYVRKAEWIHSVKITYPEINNKAKGFHSNFPWGQTARMEVKIDANKTGRDLARFMLKIDGSNREMYLLERTSFKDID